MAIKIKDISKEKNIKFENLLLGIAKEEVISRFSKSAFAKHIWFCEYLKLDLDSYRNNLDRSMEFAYESDSKATMEGTPGAKLNDRLKGALVLALCGGTKGANRMEGRIGTDGDIYLDVYVENMRVPIRVSVFPVKPGKYNPKSASFTQIITEEKVDYLAYPIESVMARDIYYIVKNLELATDMRVFERLYNEISTNPVEAKLIWTELKTLTDNDIREYNAQTLLRIRGYKRNPDMLKKWDNYKKRQKNLSVDWKKTINVIVIFLDPIWEALCEDRPFIGDWIPELGRFL